MSEYIERERLLVLAKYIANMYSPTGLAAPKIIKLIERIKKADVVEVVRCKDCEYFRSIDYNLNKCEEHSDGWGDHTVYVGEDDFCSYGKRKEGADNGNGCL